jgi:hypothetical protein
MLAKLTRRPEVGVVITPPRMDSKDEILFYWNPSITVHKGEVYICFRGYAKSNVIWQWYSSILAMSKYVDGKVVGFKRLEPEFPPIGNDSNSLEDVRIWSDGEKLWGIGNCLTMKLVAADTIFSRRRRARGIRTQSRATRRTLNQEQAEAVIDYDKGKYKIVKRFGNPREVSEKNWLPIDNEPHTYLHSIGVLAHDGQLVPVSPSLRGDKLHNGTPLILVDDHYIGIFHQRVRLLNDVNRYSNVFVKFDKSLRPIEQSDFFIFDDEAHQEVQFISGMDLIDDEFWITVGIDRILPTTQAEYKGLLYKVKPENIKYKPFDYENIVITEGELV